MKKLIIILAVVACSCTKRIDCVKPLIENRDSLNYDTIHFTQSANIFYSKASHDNLYFTFDFSNANVGT